MSKDFSQLTFSILDGVTDCENVIIDPGSLYPLQLWYANVCRTPLSELSVGDLCIACRQEVHLEEVAPLCLNILEADPLSGEKYEGEMAVALRGIRPWYWATNPDQLDRLFKILQPAFVQHGEDELKPELIKH